MTSAAGMKVKLKNAQNAKAEAATDALASGAEPSALDRSAGATPGPGGGDHDTRADINTARGSWTGARCGSATGV